MENAIMVDQLQNQPLPSQGKNQKASEGWFDLITQIALDYRRLSQVNECAVSSTDKIKDHEFNEVDERLAV